MGSPSYTGLGQAGTGAEWQDTGVRVTIAKGVSSDPVAILAFLHR
jgi:hypothetical protein